MIEGPLPGEKPVLHVYDLKERKDDKVVEDLSSYALSADGKKVLYKVEKDYFIADAVADKGKSEDGQKEAGSVTHARAGGANPGMGGDVQLGVAARTGLLFQHEDEWCGLAGGARFVREAAAAGGLAR